MSRSIVVGYDLRTSDAAPVRFAVAAAELSRARVVIASVEAGSPVLPISAARTVAYTTSSTPISSATAALRSTRSRGISPRAA